MSTLTEDECTRCGEQRAGRHRWMFYSNPLARFPEPPFGREFYCERCARIMKVYAIIGFVLVAAVITCIVGATIWANTSMPTP